MHPDLQSSAEHMREYAFNILGRAVYDAAFSEMMRPFAHVLAVVHAAHGAEIMLKARIAQEHPLLIFKSYPRSSSADDRLSMQELFDSGRTYQYSELPELLWSTTGYRMKHVDRFQAFGTLRNGLVHFAAPAFDASTETLRFVFEVLDPIAWDFWDETFVDYAVAWDDVIIAEGYLQEMLGQLKVDVDPRTKNLLEESESG